MMPTEIRRAGMPILWFTAMIPAAMTKTGISGVRFPRLRHTGTLTAAMTLTAI